MPSTAARQWWRRAAAAAKDKRSLCLARVAAHGGMCNSDMEAAVIRATSHDERALDYKNARRVFAWARASPASFLSPLMWALARRASRTRCWAVALKSLLLAHGLLLCSSAAASAPVVGRLPFDLSDFHDRSPRFWGHSAFIRAYFSFLDHRSLFIAHRRRTDEDESDGLERVEKLQALLDLLMQIRPYGDGMETGLIREAMDCALIEIFDVYSGICNGIATFLAGYMKSGSSASSSPQKNGLLGIQVVRRASEQIDQLSAYFELCQRLGVPNADGLPPVEKIPEEDIRNLEKVVMKGLPVGAEEGKELISNEAAADKWVVFDNAAADKGKDTGNESFWNLLDSPPPETWASMVQHRDAPFKYEIGNLIEL